MHCAQWNSHPVKSEPSGGTSQELKTLVGIDVDPTALELATGRLEAQKPPATQLHLLPGNVRCGRLSASGDACLPQKLRGMRSAESLGLYVLQSAAGASAPGAGLQRRSLCQWHAHGPGGVLDAGEACLSVRLAASNQQAAVDPWLWCVAEAR